MLMPVPTLSVPSGSFITPSMLSPLLPSTSMSRLPMGSSLTRPMRRVLMPSRVHATASLAPLPPGLYLPTTTAQQRGQRTTTALPPFPPPSLFPLGALQAPRAV